MRGLAVRQRSIADNIANVETPGFVANTVDFESSLRNALAEGDSPMAVQATTTPTTDAISPNSSNVNVDKETVSLIDTDLRYQLMVQALNSKFHILRSSLGG
ncbi:MAG: flagellar biosynthesis protein FlgB [Acidobacteria bacterium]|nr:flagellar biosynthesis protein FlgB [Acidobacteriota bacterium]